jgi:catechol 2,3-dioxygenase-like lactoylglutathione lyase family enzyme
MVADKRSMGAPEFALDHVQLAMPKGQEELARSFYVQLLGFEEVPKPPELAQRGGAWFRARNVALHLGVDESFIPAKKAHPALRCSRYDALVQHLAINGVEVIEDPLPFEGKRHCYIADPFGNRIELIEA